MGKKAERAERRHEAVLAARRLARPEERRRRRLRQKAAAKAAAAPTSPQQPSSDAEPLPAEAREGPATSGASGSSAQTEPRPPVPPALASKTAWRQRLGLPWDSAEWSGGPSVVLHLGFLSAQSPKEQGKLISQLGRMWGRLKASPRPPRVALAAFPDASSWFAKECSRRLDGFDGWLWRRTSVEPEELFPPSDLVLLSPDAEEVLEGVEAGKAYVVGGIVDESVQKGLTKDHSHSRGLVRRRLPVREATGASGRGAVLTVNQAFDVLLRLAEGTDLHHALRDAVPKRHQTH